MNVHTIVDGRLVEEPRGFKTKDGKELLSVRVADNSFGADKKYETMFVSFVLGEGLARVVRERGLTKGDIISVTGDLRIRLFERKGKGKSEGVAYEIPYVQSFRIQRCAADVQGPREPAALEPEEVSLDDDPFED